jgi:hypothetical protein
MHRLLRESRANTATPAFRTARAQVVFTRVFISLALEELPAYPENRDLKGTPRPSGTEEHHDIQAG